MATDRALCRLIDHTLLRPEALPDEIDRLCDDARAFGFRTVCVQPVFVARAARALAGTDVGVAAVVAFPHGATTTDEKVFEARQAIDAGATELDVVANLGWIRGGDLAALSAEIGALVAACGAAPLKVILETALFDDARKEAAARAVAAAGAAFVKTSTGFGPGGATVADVALLRRAVGAAVGVKASGGVKTRAFAQALVAAGANRLGASASIALVTTGD